MTETPSKREQLREERRLQILEAALAVFVRKGFNAANVSDVAAQAGVSQGTIYWYFDSKEQLLEETLMSFFVDFGEETIAAVGECETASQKLRALVQIMESFADMAKGFFALFLEFWASSSRREKAGQLWTSLLVEYKDVIVQIIEEGVRDGEFRAVDAESLVWAMMAAYDGLAAYILLIPDLDLVQVSQVFTDTLLRGLTTGQEESGAVRD